MRGLMMHRVVRREPALDKHKSDDLARRYLWVSHYYSIAYTWLLAKHAVSAGVQ